MTRSKYKPYPEYKDSGVEWLGRVPTHWNVKKYGWIFKSAMGQTILGSDLIEDGQYPVYSATEKGGIFGRINSPRILLQEGDLIIPARGVSIGYVIMVSEPATTTQTTIYSKRINDGISSKFAANYLLSLKDVLFYYDRTAIPQITVEQVSGNPFLLPPTSEQKVIEAFLTRETSRIDRLIEKKERFIELLKEKRQALITYAVTNGVPAVASAKEGPTMKDSGIEWIGEVPAHWEVKKIKHIATGNHKCSIQIGPFGGMLTGLTYDDEGQYKLYGQENILSDNFDKGRRWVSEETFLELQIYHLQEGDILFTRKGSIGGCTVTPAGVAKGIIDSDTIRLRKDESEILTDFFLFVIKDSSYIKAQLEEVKRGAILSGLNTSTISNLTVVIPPLSEQELITAYLIEETNRMKSLLEKTQTSIDLLRERRTALITAAVTGQIDVRESA